MADGSLHPDVAPPDVSTLGDEDDDAWAQLQFRQLQRLAAIGLKIAEALEAQVEVAAGDPEVIRQLGVTHDRVTRSVRRTHALEARLRRDLKADACARRAKRKAEADAQRAEARTQRKQALRRVARQAIADHQPAFEQHDLERWLDERLQDPCDDEALLDRPFSTLLLEICEALGLTPDFAVWRYEPWAIAEVRDRPPGSEFARFHDDMVREGNWTEEEGEGEDIDPASPPDAHPPP